MMVFSFHMAFGVLLIAFVAGIALFFKAKKYDSAFGKFLGGLVALLAFAHLACTSYYGISFWKKGFYDMQMLTNMHQQRGPVMMNNQPVAKPPVVKQ